MEIGLRVVRGPDWKWGNQDGGDGHVGTLVEIGKPGSPTSPDKTVVVQWDAGTRTNYRVGYQGAFDLRIWDNATIGVKHPNIVCDGCKRQGISGMRWKCLKCSDFDLCTQCFMEDHHDLSHPFSLYENSSSLGVPVNERKNMSKIPVKGIFVGAKVIRGPDWDWGNQDGGDGKVGRVIDIRGWDNESGQSVGNVAWTSGSTNVYRIGHKGKVDLRLVQASTGGRYYRESLPVLGFSCDAPNRPSREPGSPRILGSTFSVGDKVKIMVDAERLREMQEGHGGWNPRMADCIDQIGCVHRVTERADIRVQFDGISQRWTFNPRAIHRLSAFSVGDAVRITDDVAEVKQLQRGHGEWVDIMRSTLGKIGKVTRVYDDGDLRVIVDGQTWTWNPLCLTPLPGSASELHNTMAASIQQEHTNPLASLLSHLLISGPQQQHQPQHSPQQIQPQEENNELSVADRLVRAAAQGQADIVQELLNKYVDKVDAKSSGKTCLQVASHQGHLELVSLLLSRSASLEVADDDGDTALHYAAFGNQSEVMETLIKKGAVVDCSNRGRCTPLHVAVNKQFPACVNILLKYGCDVNIQDSYGDTALHDSIGKENVQIVEALASASAVDFTLRNKRGFNVLHHASLKGNYFAAERIIMRSRQLVDVRKDDGFAALHLASLNGHIQLAKLLLDQGLCSVDPLNNRRQTPLILAVSQGHDALVELLVDSGADVKTVDEDGDTGIHVACLKLHSLQGEANCTTSPNIYHIQQTLQTQGRCHSNSLSLAIACYLVQLGCDPELRNRKGKTAADIVADATVWDNLISYVNRRNDLLSAEDGAVSPELVQEESCKKEEQSTLIATSSSVPSAKECIVCYDTAPDIRFKPCGHTNTCSHCAPRMKKCLECHVIITTKTSADGNVIESPTGQQSGDRLQYLESRIAEIEETYTCSICMERRRNVAFLCGHGACDNCSQTLRTCHMCRKIITRKINLY